MIEPGDPGIVGVSPWDQAIKSQHFSCSRCGQQEPSTHAHGVLYRHADGMEFAFVVCSVCAEQLSPDAPGADG